MNTRHAFLFAVCALAPIACKKGASGPVVAHVGDDVITAEEFKRRIDEQSPFLRARYSTVERKKELLEALIRNELLAFYDAHVDDYVKPERARVYHIFLPAKEPKEKAQAKARAAALLKDIQAREKKGEVNAFQATAIKESKDLLSAPMGGDLRFLSKEELAKSHGAALADAAFGLKNPGEVAGPLETPAGIELVKLQVKTVALNRTFEESKETVRGRMARERRSRQYDDFVKKLRDGGKVVIDEAELAKVNAEAAPVPVASPQASPAPAAAKIGGN